MSLTLARREVPVHLGLRLFLPASWIDDTARVARAGVPARQRHHAHHQHGRIATVVATQRRDGVDWAVPDTLIGTDSHTPMVNGIGVLDWGVGGIMVGGYVRRSR